MSCSTGKPVKEGSSSTQPVRFRNQQGELQAPVSCDYRIDCPDAVAPQQIRDWTALSILAATMEIPLTPADNVMKNGLLKEERHVITVRANFGLDDVLMDDYTYIVKNLAYA